MVLFTGALQQLAVRHGARSGVRADANTLVSGVITGAPRGFLFCASVDLGFMAMMNYFNDSTGILVDVLANTA